MRVKLTAFILVTMFLQVSLGARGQLVTLLGTSEQLVTLNEKNAPLEKVLKEIRKQTGYDFFYDSDLIKATKPISINVNQVDLKDVLDYCFADRSLVYTLEEKTVIVKKAVTAFNPTKDIDVKGKVTDEKGKPLIDVSVTVKNTNKITKTNNLGEFEFKGIDEKAILVFSYLGFKTKEVPASQHKPFNIILELKSFELDAVTVVSMGVFKRPNESFTGSATTIGKEELLKVSGKNIIQSLKTLEPSLMVFDNLELGSDPNKLPEIRLRGTSSFPVNQSIDLNAASLNDPNQPLFILDGFETSLVKVIDLDMNRIESVTILKDASAKALYGSKAANGVIVIETKKRTGGQVGISYSASTDIEAPDLSSYNLMNSAEKLEAERIYGMYSQTTVGNPNYQTQLTLDQQYNRRLEAVLSGVNTDWLSKPLRNGVGQKHAISFELGETNLKVIGDFSYNQISGVMKGSSRNTLSSSISTSYRYKKFLFSNILTITGNKSNDSPYGSFSEYSTMNPYTTPYDEFGNMKQNAETGIIPYAGSASIGNFYAPNPLYNSTLSTKLTNNYTDVTNNLYTEFFISDGLKSTLRVGLTKTSSQADQFYPANHLKFANFSQADFFRKGSYSRMEGDNKGLSGDFNVSYSKTIEKHSVFANVGANMSEKSYENVTFQTEGFPNDRMTDILFANQYSRYNNRPTGSEGTTRDVGLLSVFSYMYDSRFLADVSYRTSASSQFGSNNRWGNFWSTGLGWNMHNEEFIKKLNVFDRLKLRSSIGSTGSQNFSSYQSIATYKYYLDKIYQGYLGAYLMGLANDDLKWQQKMDYNVGLDASFLKKFSTRLDYYQSITQNTLIDYSLPPSTGFSNVKENLGKIRNIGVEAMLTYNVYSNPKNKTFLSFTASAIHNKNKILSISDALKTFNEEQEKRANDVYNNKPVVKYYDGMSMDAIWAVRSLGIDPANGKEIYIDRNGNKTYTYSGADMVVVGDKMPAVSGTFGINGGYKGFGVNLYFRYLTGGQIYNQTLVDRVENVNMSYNVDKRVLNSTWQKPGDVKPFKSLGSVEVQNPDGSWTRQFLRTQPSDRFVMARSEFSLSSLNLSYDFYKSAFIGKLGVERVRCNFYMNDVFLLSSVGIERGLSYPFARKCSFSLQIQL
ncbi:SusC/RagA family TonB-linked outer membrane protein [Solitalea koreensis]|nr:SusC/RagA family TonB-linked outer membrane protein [Solitalea koreensis]